MASSELVAMYTRIHKVIRKIPRGAVATYGQVAELAGIPGGARVAARGAEDQQARATGCRGSA